jgi:hypothetical protein
VRAIFKRGARVALVGTAAAALVFAVAAPAMAAPQNPIDPNLLDNGPGTADDIVIGIAGSDTLEFVTNDIIKTFPGTVRDNVYNIKPGGTATGNQTVYTFNSANTDTTLGSTLPGDAFCATHTYDVGEGAGQTAVDTDLDGILYPPNGSSAGRTALQYSGRTGTAAGEVYGSTAIDTGDGCIDVARMSSRPGSGDVNYEAYGFALDAVGWGSTSLKAPVTLTLQQLRDIYNCVITDWGVVGGSPGPIRRAIAQTGSGTRAFFIANVLNGVTPPNSPALEAAGCPNTLEVQESDGTELLGVNSGDYDKYIVNYSIGKWVYQVTNSSNPTLDLRGGVRMGAITRAAAETCPSIPAATTITGADPAITLGTENDTPSLGVRYDGAGYILNNATLICSTSISGVTHSGIFDTTLNAAAGTFKGNMIGYTVTGTGINDGTVISAVNAAGSEATLSIGAANPPLSGGTVSLGISVVSEFNPNISTATNNQIFPGVRILNHVLWGTGTTYPAASPSYDDALALFGFAPSNGGKSPLCDGENAGDIVTNGFLDLPAVTNNGTTGTTCRFFTT